MYQLMNEFKAFLSPYWLSMALQFHLLSSVAKPFFAVPQVLLRDIEIQCFRNNEFSDGTKIHQKNIFAI
jgi:hypothetical protein